MAGERGGPGRVRCWASQFSVHAPRAEQTFDEAGFPAEAAVVLAAGMMKTGCWGAPLLVP